MRCLTLGEALRARGDEVQFIVRAHEGNLAPTLRARGFPTHLLPSPIGGRDVREMGGPYPHSHWLGVSEERDAEECLRLLGEGECSDLAALRREQAARDLDLLVVDHYSLGAPFERALSARFRRIVAIDDLADRPHEVDALIDASLRLGEPASALYASLIPPESLLLSGPKYAILRDEFVDARPAALSRRDGSLRRLLVSMGGIDADDRTSAILNALRAFMPEKVDVVMGSRAPALAKVEELVASLPYAAELHVDTPIMARLMSEADLAIGAAGGTAYERACLGLPSLVMGLAENQRTNVVNLVRAGAAIEVSPDALEGPRLAEMLRALSPERMQVMSRAAAALVDGRGTQRILRAIESLLGKK